MRHTFSALALVSVVLLGAGCKKGPSLVGKWNFQAGAGNLVFEFKPDGAFSINTKFGQFSMTETGDYKQDGEKLTLTAKGIDAPNLPASALAQAKQSPSFGKPQDLTVKFVSDDEVTVSGLPGSGASSPKALTLKRVRE